VLVLVRVLVLVLVLPLACSACGPAAPTAQAPVDVDVGQAREDAGPKPMGVRYSLPSCPLAYEVLMREKSYEEDQLLFDTERFMTLEATAQRGRMQLTSVVLGRSIRDGVREPGRPDASYAPPLLETDGLRWTEREGPTWLFSDVGTQGGLAWFFPTLPPSAEKDATTVWNVPYESGQSTAALRTEATRGHMQALKASLQQREASGEKEREIPTTFTRAEIRFQEWRQVDGVRVAVFGMTGERHDKSKPGEDPHFAMDRTYRGTYEVTAGGRILRAHVESSRTTVSGSEAAGIRQRFREDTDGKMHLVKACDGPAAEKLEPVLTAEERAAPVDDRLRIEVAPPRKKK
jgi:hypothetical protein